MTIILNIYIFISDPYFMINLVFFFLIKFMTNIAFKSKLLNLIKEELFEGSKPK